jgi:uncharacterized protein YgiM (DUF1202 family)
MIKKIIFIFILLALYLAPKNSNAQSYTTESKSCGSCHKEVSVNSRIGMKCPHCGVIWGKENETRTTKTTNSYSDYDYSTKYYSTATPKSRCNVRSYPSTDAAIIGKADSDNVFDVIEVKNGWVKIKFSEEGYYGQQDAYGWISRSLLYLK